MGSFFVFTPLRSQSDLYGSQDEAEQNTLLNANRQKKQIHPSKLFSFQVQVTDLMKDVWRVDKLMQ